MAPDTTADDMSRLEKVVLELKAKMGFVQSNDEGNNKPMLQQPDKQESTPTKRRRVENGEHTAEQAEAGTNTAQNQERKRQNPLLERLKCSVCQELPRAGIIEACKNGHINCNTCKEKLEVCSLCRNEDLNCRQLFAEAVLQAETKGMVIKCKHMHCKTRGSLKDITEHEEV